MVTKTQSRMGQTLKRPLAPSRTSLSGLITLSCCSPWTSCLSRQHFRVEISQQCSGMEFRAIKSVGAQDCRLGTFGQHAELLPCTPAVGF